MDMPVFFNQFLQEDKILTLDEETSRHVVQVLRMKPAENIQLTNGLGLLYTAAILDDNKKKCSVQLIEKKLIPKKDREICIGISLLKNTGRFEWFLEKVTEIGVTEIIPMLCKRTEKQHFRLDRTRQIVISAMLQSKQVWLPILHEPNSFDSVIASSKYFRKLVAHCEDTNRQPLKDFSGETSMQILIGPEGDFSAEEISRALQNNYQPVSLGETRLRSETAGVFAAAVLC